MSHLKYACSAGRKSQPPGYSFESQDYEHFQLVFVRHGNLYFQHEKRVKALGPGEFLVLRRGGAFRLSCGSRGYSGVHFSAYQGDPLFLPGEPISMPASTPMAALVELMDQEINRPGPDSQEVICSLGRALAHHGLRLAESPGRCRDQRDYSLYWAECARQALAATTHAKLNPREALASLPLGYRQLARHFTAIHGLSPKAYQIRQRLAEAARLLKQTDRPVTAIAHELHWSSSQHFATQFLEHMGMPPSAWREQGRNKSSRTTDGG